MNIGFKIRSRGGINNATNCSSDNGFGKAKPCIRSEGMMPLGAPLGTGSCVAEAPHTSVSSRKNGSIYVSSLVSLALHELLLLGMNLQLALRTIRSRVSVLTRNRPWVTGEVQLAPRSFT